MSLPDDSTNTFVRTLKDVVRPDTSMVLVILPTNRKDRYDAIKVYCCVENPGTILSHCFIATQPRLDRQNFLVLLVFFYQSQQVMKLVCCPCIRTYIKFLWVM